METLPSSMAHVSTDPAQGVHVEALAPQPSLALPPPSSDLDEAAVTAEIILPEPAPAPTRSAEYSAGPDAGLIDVQQAHSPTAAATDPSADESADTTETEPVHEELAPSAEPEVIEDAVYETDLAGADSLEPMADAVAAEVKATPTVPTPSARELSPPQPPRLAVDGPLAPSIWELVLLVAVTVANAVGAIVHSTAEAVLWMAQQVIHGVVWTGQQLVRSEHAQWAASTTAAYVWAFVRAFFSTGVAAGAMALRLCTQVVFNSVAGLIDAAPVMTRAMLTTMLTRPEKLAAAVTTLGAVHCFYRAFQWHQRWRESRRAARAAQVDAASRWVLTELRSHAARWTPISGSCPPLPPSELRARLPPAILADRRLWSLVAKRVREDVSVRVVPAGDEGAPREEEGWVFSMVFSPPNSRCCKPTSAYSAMRTATPPTAFSPTAAFSPPSAFSPRFASPPRVAA